MDLDSLNEKEFFSIGEISKISGVPEHSLRYWEKEFGLIRPVRKASGHRRYTRKDVQTVLDVKDLIYKGKLTLEGARKYIKNGSIAGQSSARVHSDETYKLLRELHKDICNILKEW
ncbi:MAG: MerR family transcriptional regulator [Elusimicrobiaceae bacterium]|jgi:DNA-binding transcriptional MerR regulator